MGVEYNEEEYQKALPLLRLQMKALIARDLWDMNEYYQPAVHCPAWIFPMYKDVATSVRWYCVVPVPVSYTHLLR